MDGKIDGRDVNFDSTMLMKAEVENILFQVEVEEATLEIDQTTVMAVTGTFSVYDQDASGENVLEISVENLDKPADLQLTSNLSCSAQSWDGPFSYELAQMLVDYKSQNYVDADGEMVLDLAAQSLMLKNLVTKLLVTGLGKNWY